MRSLLRLSKLKGTLWFISVDGSQALVSIGSTQKACYNGLLDPDPRVPQLVLGWGLRIHISDRLRVTLRLLAWGPHLKTPAQASFCQVQAFFLHPDRRSHIFITSREILFLCWTALSRRALPETPIACGLSPLNLTKWSDTNLSPRFSRGLNPCEWPNSQTQRLKKAGSHD